MISIINKDKFWIVTPDYESSETRFRSFKDAISAAIKCSEKYPNIEFYILESVKCVESQTMTAQYDCEE